jgi:spore maturation protein CgeB
LKIVVLGLSVTSSWGNGHATTFRALLSALHRREHKIVFFEKNQEWYESNRDLRNPEFCEVHIFEDWHDVLPRVKRELTESDVAILGSYFPDGISAADELANSRVPVKVFYDIDTPITYSKLGEGGAEYLQARQVPYFDLYLSFTGGPVLDQLWTEFGARRAVPFYCSFEPEKYRPHRVFRRYQSDLSYMGTYAADRQSKLQELFVAPAQKQPDRKFLLAGPQYPTRIKWPGNVRHIKHLNPRWHPHFYSSSRLTLNLTREAMVQWGFSPSVRLFEAAACGCPIVSDQWNGLDTILKVGHEILVAENNAQVISFMRDMDDDQLQTIGLLARERVLEEHSSARRAEEFERYVSQAADNNSRFPSHFPVAASAAVVPRGQAQPIS